MATKKKTLPPVDPEKRAMLEELGQLAAALGTDDVAMLLSQARIFSAERQHEAYVDEANRMIDERNAKAQKSAKQGKARNDGGNAEIVARNELLRSSSGDTWHWQCGGEDKILNSGEMNSLAKIAFTADNDAGAALGMMRWFDRERRDILNDLGISGPNDANLRALVRLLRDKLKTKQPPAD